MKRKNLFLGVFFVFLGIFFLLNNLNIINFSIWNALFDLWPLFFVMLGVHLISNKTSVTIFSWIVFFAIILLYAISIENGSLNLEFFNINKLI